MSKCCGRTACEGAEPHDSCAPGDRPCSSSASEACASDVDPLAWFGSMVDHCYDYAVSAHAAGTPIVGIMCEYAPRELIMAAGAVPVCLCGGDANTIPAAEKHLPVNLCPLIKSTYGYHVERSNPFLEMAALVVAETTCDGKKKMFELLAESRPTHVLELPQKESDAEALAHWLAELHRFRSALEARFGIEITTDRLREAIRLMNHERALRRRLAALMVADTPPLTGRELLDLKSSISCMPGLLGKYDEALNWLGERKHDRNLSTRVRVLMTGVPVVHGAERVVDIIEDNGGLIVCMENCSGLKPILEDVDETADDLMAALARKYDRLPCSVKTKNERRIDSLRQLAAEYRPACVIELIWQACLTYDVESHRVKRLAEEELGVPYLRIETDYSPSDSARIRVRVEALFETARTRAESNSAEGRG